MLYVIYGTDTQKTRARARAVVAALQKKRPDATLIRVEAASFDPSALPELIGGQGLFSEKQIVWFDHALADTAGRDAFLAATEAAAASPNAFLILESSFDAKAAKLLEKRAERVEHFDLTKSAERPFNTFALADALGARDRKKLWALYRAAKDRGIADEEIHGVLFWIVKAMLLARSAASAASAGQKPFVFQKAKHFAVNFPDTQLVEISRSLVRLYHEARLGERDFALSLEAFLLRL